MYYKLISEKEIVFHKRTSPETGLIIGYGALILFYKLKVPLPDKLSLISEKHRKYSTDEWNVFTPRHRPDDNIYGHLSFALKYEGIDLNILNALFSEISKEEIEKIILNEPTGKYTRKIWFLYEWLTEDRLNINDLKIGNFIELVDPKLQYCGSSENSSRHRIKNNLPGVKNFCPLIRKTEKLELYIKKDLSKKSIVNSQKISKNLLNRTNAFLLLKDSKASYDIEGESPTQDKLQKWGRVLGMAGKIELSKEEFLRLQELVMENEKFSKYGWRTQGGFIGEHDRETATPIPEHISSKWQDLDLLISGLLDTYKKLVNSDFDPVLVATVISFGFVFIHPFVDGNGRIHRYIINHILAKMNFIQNSFFPVSSSILDRINEYRDVLISYSYPRLDLIKWKTTDDNNVEVINNTIDFYRYFDATKQSEFIYSCIEETIEKIIPEEIKYLDNYDKFKSFINNNFDIPDKTISLLVSFLNQGKGKLSKRARSKEFSSLNNEEINNIESSYQDIFIFSS